MVPLLPMPALKRPEEGGDSRWWKTDLEEGHHALHPTTDLEDHTLHPSSIWWHLPAASTLPSYGDTVLVSPKQLDVALDPGQGQHLVPQPLGKETTCTDTRWIPASKKVGDVNLWRLNIFAPRDQWI